MGEASAGFAQHIAKWHMNQFQMGFQTFKFSRGQSGQEVVLVELLGGALHPLKEKVL